MSKSLAGGSPNGKAADFGSADQGSIPCPSANQIDQALEAIPVEVPESSQADLALREALWKNLKELGVEAGGMDLTGLSDVTPEQLEETDHARLARLAYGMSYVRVLEFLARRAPSFAGNKDQANLAFAYLKHVETNDRDILKLNQRTQGDQYLDQALTQMQREVVRIALIKERLIKRVSSGDGQAG